MPRARPAALTLRDVLHRRDLGPAGSVPFAAATRFSARVVPGGLFAALPGATRHGAAFLAEAAANGAAVVLSDRPLPGCPVPVAAVGEARDAFGAVCDRLHGSPSSKLPVVGVTGTNGKSAVAWLLRSVFASPPQADDLSSPRVAGLCGTIETDDGRTVTPSTLTTPATEDLHAWLARCAAHGCAGAAVELSSHALHQDRPAGVTLAAAVLTNLTRDHLDYHRTPEALRDAKFGIIRFVCEAMPMLVNLDDAGVAACLKPHRLGRLTIDPEILSRVFDAPIEMTEKLCPPVFTFGTNPAAAVRATDLSCGPAGSTFTLHLMGEEPMPIATPLLGRFNVSNALAAATAAWACGAATPAQVAAGLRDAAPVPGRLERIDRGQPFAVLVDYAHTPDGLRTVLGAVRPLTSGRLLLVVGAGGDRDRGKRPAMGAAAGAADLTIFTSDNPRSEDPAAILRRLSAGHPDPRRSETIEDRRAAIRRVLALARPADCVLICGKGHETTQEARGVKRPFDDRAVCGELLAELGYDGGG